MLNVEKYLDDLKYIWEHTAEGIAVNATNGKPVACEDIPCVRCAYFPIDSCEFAAINWMFKKAKEDEND